MRNLATVIVLSTLMLACSNSGSGGHNMEHTHDSLKRAVKDTSKKSIPSEEKGWIGNTNIKINYHSPAVRGRTIWGGLVAYNAVCVTGAHSATTLEVGKDFQVGGKTVPGGKYAIFTIPGKEEWTIIINKNWNQHLADDYAEKDDVVRVKVKPQTTEDFKERLKYQIDKKGEGSADIIISWEKIKVLFALEVL